ncbi:MAG: FMN-binding protein [Ruminococcaceae bacterium]|nr:FMN-binding protein [Oscillospiraceae bacterium]
MSNILNKIKSLLNSNSDIFRPIAVLTAICLVVAILLSFTNLITKDTIANMELKASNDAMSVLISAEKYEKADVEGELYIAKNGEEVKGYIVKTVGRGYGGDVVIMTAISTDKKVMGVKILSAADETPGLGQNVTKESFYSQYIGKTENITVLKNGANSDKNEINAVTGATVSSKAVTGAVNKAFECLNGYLKTTQVVTETAGEVQ